MESIKLFALFALVGVVAADFKGVDPNTLSCDPAGQVFLLLPHFTDCTKYYMCVHGREQEMSCPSSLYFDFELQTCNWDWATKCWLRSNDEDGSGEEDIEGSGEEDIEGSGDEPSFEETGGRSIDILNDIIMPSNMEVHSGVRTILNCHSLASASQQVAYRGDCQRYWRCENGVPQAVYCTDGLYFNPNTRQCDFEANVKCFVEQDDELNGEFIEYK